MADDRNSDRGSRGERREREDPADSGTQASGARRGAAITEKSGVRNVRRLALAGLVVVALIAVVIFAISHRSKPSETRVSGGAHPTLQDYFSQNAIRSVPVLRGDPGAPAITLPLPPGWSDAGSDIPEGAYGAVFFDNSANPDYPPSIVALLSKLEGDADPEKVLEYAAGELENLPDYEPVSDPSRTTLSGFEAVQLGGLYSQGGAQRIIAQKTVLIPSGDGLFILQLNADAPKGEATVLQEATTLLDEQAKIET